MHVTTPMQGLRESLRLAAGGWQDDVVRIMQEGLGSLSNLQYVGVAVSGSDTGNGCEECCECPTEQG